MKISHKGKTQTVCAWSKDCGIDSSTLQRRIDRGWDFERAITEPANEVFKATGNGSSKEFAQRYLDDVPSFNDLPKNIQNAILGYLRNTHRAVFDAWYNNTFLKDNKCNTAKETS
jgi:KaiC/GvpD/RAD55 family RecA-like ATPase